MLVCYKDCVYKLFLCQHCEYILHRECSVHRQCREKAGAYCGFKGDALAAYQQWETTYDEEKVKFIASSLQFVKHGNDLDDTYQYNGDLYSLYVIAIIFLVRITLLIKESNASLVDFV
jgi:hypothetical protein